MPILTANGMQIAYDINGSDGNPAMLLIQGLGMPMSAWPPALIDLLVREGFQVVTMDNRDVGRSTQFDVDPPAIAFQILRKKLGLRVHAPYLLTDMARDVCALMDALGIACAHVVGVSMGGMIAQIISMELPEKVHSLTSIMSTTGGAGLPAPNWEVTRHIMSGPEGHTMEHRLAYHRILWRLIGSPGYRQTDRQLQSFLERIFERGMTASGTRRQSLAILAAENREPGLRDLDVPTLVMHGDADPLVPVACGYRTAETIPDAKLTVIQGMGHDLPEQLLAQISTGLAKHARAAQLR